MANTWFQFRQFRIEQDRCAMKVSTDACLFGAWAPLPAGVRSVLDVGTGTGLLALMLAQRFPAVHITALELDLDAAAQARANAAASPFADRIVVETADARFWTPGKRFDALICNPPFFHRSLQSPDPARTAARHGDAFGLQHLLALLDRALTPDGTATVLLPAARTAEWAALLAGQGWFVDAALDVCPRAGQAPNRWMGRCTRGMAVAPPPDTLVLYDATGQYTKAADALLAPFYLPKTGPQKAGLE